MSLAIVSCSNENGQGCGATHGRREKENLVPLKLSAGLISSASKARKNERTLADSRLEMEVIRQCDSFELEDYKPFQRT